MSVPTIGRTHPMIFRRVKAHIEKENWFAVLVDFCIVVVGVFIGIQVANWNAERLERTQERDYLTRLHGDFVESIKGQSRDLNFLDQELSDQAIIIKSLDACAVSSVDKAAFQRGINTLGYINPPRIVRSTVDEMIAAGRTDIIRNEALKEQLSEIIALVEWRGNGFSDSVARTTEHYRYIIEEKVQYDLTRRYPDPFMKEFIGVDFDIQELCMLPQLARAVSAVSYTTLERRRAYAPILQSYEDFLPVIEDELQARWGDDLTQVDGATP